MDFLISLYIILPLGFTCLSNVGLAQKTAEQKLDPRGFCGIHQIKRKVAWAYSPADQMLLAKFEADLYKEFGSRTPKENPLLFERSELYEALQEWISDYSETSLKASNGTSEDSKVYTHPFLAQRMINRASFLGTIVDGPELPIKPGTNEGRFFKKVDAFGAKVKLPTTKDVENAIQSIVWLKFLYDFSVYELMSGKFGDTPTQFGLDLEAAYELGIAAYDKQMLSESLDWFQKVYRRLNEVPGGSLGSISNSTVLEHILQVSEEHDSIFDKIAENPKAEKYHRFNHKISSGQKLLTKRSEEVAMFKETGDINLIFPAYSLLCAGENHQTEVLKSRLMCWLERGSDPAWTISPLKVEVHHWDPYLIEIHEAVGETTIGRLREASMENMDRACVMRVAPDGSSLGYVSTYRMASQVTLLETMPRFGDHLKALNVKIGRMTQLAVSNVDQPYSGASEPLKITAYATGGTFAPHLDPLEGLNDPKWVQVGDRVATFMVYLNDVYRGGYTVFPSIGVAIVPKKGSAVFWYGLYKNGTVDKRMMHAGCPVILGEKWSKLPPNGSDSTPVFGNDSAPQILLNSGGQGCKLYCSRSG